MLPVLLVLVHLRATYNNLLQCSLPLPLSLSLSLPSSPLSSMTPNQMQPPPPKNGVFIYLFNAHCNRKERNPPWNKGRREGKEREKSKERNGLASSGRSPTGSPTQKPCGQLFFLFLFIELRLSQPDPTWNLFSIANCLCGRYNSERKKKKKKKVDLAG